jgi:hypothetical protein
MAQKYIYQTKTTMEHVTIGTIGLQNNLIPFLVNIMEDSHKYHFWLSIYQQYIYISVTKRTKAVT